MHAISNESERLGSLDMREGAIWAYRLLLNREPEDSTAIDRFANFTSVEQLRNVFVDSEEYRALTGIGKAGEFRHARPTDIQTECSEPELSAMLDRIAAEWRKFGETEPHWSVLTGPEYLSSNIDNNIEQFYRSGKSDIETLLAGPARCGIDVTHFNRVMDFGCGVGRLALALAEISDHVTGIDISPAHLAIAAQRASSTSTGNVEFIPIAHPNDLKEHCGFDLVTSYIVLQHNPPPVQNEILRNLLSTLTVGGIAVIQIPTYLVGQQAFSVPDYLSSSQPPMEMNALPQKAIFKTIDEAECRCLEVREDGVLGPLPGISNTFTIERTAK